MIINMLIFFSFSPQPEGGEGEKSPRNGGVRAEQWMWWRHSLLWKLWENGAPALSLLAGTTKWRVAYGANGLPNYSFQLLPIFKSDSGIHWHVPKKNQIAKHFRAHCYQRKQAASVATKTCQIYLGDQYAARKTKAANDSTKGNGKWQSSANVWDNRTYYKHGEQAYTSRRCLQQNSRL